MRREGRSIALALVPGTLLSGVAGGLVFPIFPIVGQRVGLSLPFIGVILAANRAMRVVTAPSVGVLADRMGARRTLLVGLALQVVVAAMYVAGMLLHREGVGFLGGRLLHGVASACVFVSAQALALHAGADSERGGSHAATVRVAIVLGIPIGFVLGGMLSDAFGDTATFAIAGAASIAAFLAAGVTVPDLRAPVAKARSLRATLRALRDRRLLAIGGLSFAISFAAGGMILTTLPLVVDARHLSVLGRSARGTSGLLMGLMSITDAAFTRFFGRIGDRFHAHARIAVLSLAIVAAGIAVIAFVPSTLGTAGGVVLVGIGIAGLGPSALVLVALVVPPEERGAGVGVTQLCADAGGMLGPLVGTALFAGEASRPYALTAILVACFIPVAVSLVPLEKRARED